MLADYGLFRWFLLAAVGMALAMALLSPTAKQVHHDEYDHFNAARFYIDNWLPPAVGDPRAQASLSLYGVSYLDEWDIVYPLAGKFAALIHPLLPNDAVAFRLFNVGLFLLLALVALRQRNEILAYALLLTSSQIWYTFSYFNGDGFAIFASFLAAAALASPHGRFNDRSRSAFARYLPLAFWLGLLLLSKRSFWTFGLFAAFCAAWLEFPRDGERRALVQFAGRMALLAGLVALTALPRIAYDVAVNGLPSRKTAKIAETAEVAAAPIFKPSASLKSGRNLRAKGVGIVAMMSAPYDWAKRSAESAFGSYNYNMYFMGPWYYRAMYAAFALFAAYVVARVWMHAGTTDTTVTGGALVFSALVVALSVHHSWVSELQPQGRYLFAIFPIFAVVLVRNKLLLNPLIVNLFFSFCFLASTYSFVAQGLLKAKNFQDIKAISVEFRPPK